MSWSVRFRQDSLCYFSLGHVLRRRFVFVFVFASWLSISPWWIRYTESRVISPPSLWGKADLWTVVRSVRIINVLKDAGKHSIHLKINWVIIYYTMSYYITPQQPRILDSDWSKSVTFSKRGCLNRNKIQTGIGGRFINKITNLTHTGKQLEKNKYTNIKTENLKNHTWEHKQKHMRTQDIYNALYCCGRLSLITFL